MENDKVSVIIPVYNVIQFLEKAVNSIIEQNYSNIEIILVDDGSTDGSDILCDLLAEKEKRVKVIHSINGGPSKARNKGLDIADGKYIYFMDSDDYLKPDLFRTVIPLLEQGYDMAVFNYRKVDVEGNVLSYSHFQSGRFEFHTVNDRVKFMLEKVFKYQIGWELWNRFFVRDIIEKNHIRFADENYAEDLYFFLCYLCCIEKIYCTEQVYYNYLIRQSSLMNLSKKKPSENLNKVNNLSLELKKFLETSDLHEELKRFYPIIHYNFLKHHINALYDENWSLNDIYRYIKMGMENSDFCLLEFEKFVGNSKLYYSLMEAYELLQDKHMAQYYCDGNMFKLKIMEKVLNYRKRLGRKK